MNADEVAVLIDVVQRALDGSPHTLEEAVRLACWTEASAAQTWFQDTLDQSNPELRRLLDHIGGDDRQHAKRLKAFAARGASRSCRRRQAELPVGSGEPMMLVAAVERRS